MTRFRRASSETATDTSTMAHNGHTLAPRDSPVKFWKDTLTRVVGELQWTRMFAVGLLIANLIAWVDVRWRIVDMKILPYINTVDVGNHVIYSGPAQGFTTPDVWMIDELQRIVVAIRARPGDLTKKANQRLLNVAWEWAYYRTRGEAKAFLEQYIDKEDPLKQKGMPEITVQPTVIITIGQSGDQNYRVEWIETTNPLSRLVRQVKYWGHFTVEIDPIAPDRSGKTKTGDVVTMKTAQDNIKGFFVTKIVWGESLI